MLLYIREELQPAEYRPRTDFPEHVWCKVTDGRGRDTLIGVCYRSTNDNLFGCDSHTRLRELLIEMCTKHVILMGDFNYSGIEWTDNWQGGESTGESQKFLECLTDCFYTQHVRQATRGDQVLDLILSTDEEVISSVEVIDHLENSDHNMITYQMDIGAEHEDYTREQYDYKKANYEELRRELGKIDWNTFLAGDVTVGWERFRDLLKRLEKKFVPKRKKKQGKVHRKAVWMTHRALKEVNRKRKKFAKYKNRNHPACIRANHRATQEVRRAKLQFETKLAENIKYDSKSFFAYARGNAASRRGPGQLIGKDGQEITDKEEVANEFNNYFASVFVTEIDSCRPPQTDGTTESTNCITNISFSEEEVRKKLGKLRPDKSAGADDILPRYLLEISDQISKPLSILFNKSIEESGVPEDWRLANVTPIFKKGERAKPENYRPVSLTSQICKIMETVIRDKMIEHLESNGLLRNSQHGFRKGRSCMSNLLEFLDFVTQCTDGKSNVDAIYLDFAKAFDKVPHRRLLRKLKRYGISDKLLKWIENWLGNRKQRVCVNGGRSRWAEVKSGVPQGSVLGPILFLIFIDDLDVGIVNRLLKFADDTKVFGKVNNEEEARRLQEDLDRLLTWSIDSQMEFNIDKCKVLHVGKNNRNHDYTLNGHKLQSVDQERDLGITVSSNLKTSLQCKQAYTKANRMLGLINRTMKNKTPEVMTRLYKSLVRPHLEYCVTAWAPHYIKDKELLERIQHRFTRLIPAYSKLPYEERLSRLGLITLEERRNRADLVELYRMTRGLSATPLETMFERDINSRTRGHSFKMRKRRCTTEIRRNFFSERVVKNWNALDEETVMAKTVNSFKKKLKQNRDVKMGLLMD